MTVVTTTGKTSMAYAITDERQVYQSLANDLIGKKLNNCLYIQSITRVNNYDGTQTITVKYNNRDGLTGAKVTRIYVVDAK